MAEETRERSTTSAGLWPEAVIGDLNNDSCWLYLMKGLVVNNGSGTSSPIINQAPNTVRRYRYSGSAWECLY